MTSGSLRPLRVDLRPRGGVCGVAPQLLDLKAAAARLALAPRTLREWAAKGRVPYIRLGRALRFAEGDLARFVDEARVGGEA